MIEPMRMIRLVAALVAMTLLLTSCRGSASEHPAHVHGADDTAAAPAPAAGDFSVYDLASAWTDQRGNPLELGDLAGTPRVVAMVYTTCAYACPRIIADMKRIEAELKNASVHVGYVVVSIDPERDTAQRLAEFAAASRLDPADWTLITGTDDTVMELAALLGVRYRRVSGTDFEHSNVITLLDGEGRIVHRQLGLGGDAAPLVAAAKGLHAHAH